MLLVNVGRKREARVQNQFTFLNQKGAVMNWTQHHGRCLLINIISDLQSECHRHRSCLCDLSQLRKAILDLRINVVLLTFLRQLPGKLTFLHYVVAGNGHLDLRILFRRYELYTQQSIAITNDHGSRGIDLLAFCRRS